MQNDYRQALQWSYTERTADPGGNGLAIVRSSFDLIANRQPLIIVCLQHNDTPLIYRHVNDSSIVHYFFHISRKLLASLPRAQPLKAVHEQTEILTSDLGLQRAASTHVNNLILKYFRVAW